MNLIYIYNPVTRFTYILFSIIIVLVASDIAILSIHFVISVLFVVISMRSITEVKQYVLMIVVFMLLITLINPVFDTAGKTVLFSYFGRGYTLESVIVGYKNSLIFVSVISLCILLNKVVIGSDLVYLMRGHLMKTRLFVSIVISGIYDATRKIKAVEEARQGIGLGTRKDNKYNISNISRVFVIVKVAMKQTINLSDVKVYSMIFRNYGNGKATTYERFKLKKIDLIVCASNLAFVFIAFIKSNMNASEFEEVLATVIYILFLILPILYIVFKNIAIKRCSLQSNTLEEADDYY